MIRAFTFALALLASAAPPLRADFSTDFRVTNAPGLSWIEIDGGANVIVDDGFVMIVWSDVRDGNSDVYFRERIVGTWQPEVPLVTGTPSSTHPAIGRFPGEVRVVFEDNRTGHPEIWMKRKVLGVWGPDSCLTCDAFESARPAMDYRGQQLVWEETKDGNREIYHRERLAGGTWGPEMRISEDAGESSHPSVATATGIDGVFEFGDPLVLVVWQDDRDGNLEIYSRHFDFMGWSEERRVTFDPGSSRFPSCTADYLNCSDVVESVDAVAWQDDRDGNDEIYLAQGTSGFWSSETRLTVTATPSRHPSAFASIHLGPGPFGGLVPCAFPAVAWEEGAAIRYRDLGPDGTDAIVSDPVAQTGAASLRLEHDGVSETRTIVVVWEDGRDGNLEIYADESQEVFRVTGAPELPATASGLVLGTSRPNPFVATTRFRVELPQASELDVRIVDAAGREVAALFRGTKFAGGHDFSWNGETAAGGMAASGTYFVVVRDVDGVAARRIVRLR